MRTKVVVLALVGVAMLVSSASATTVLFDNWNIGEVYNGWNDLPKPQFTISDSYLITYVDTYHWNSGYGMSFVGQIALRDVSNNALYGWWQAAGAPGMYGVPNALWIVEPDVVIPAGTYEVLDSLPHTWSYNEASSYVCFSRLKVPSPPPSSTPSPSR